MPFKTIFSSFQYKFIALRFLAGIVNVIYVGAFNITKQQV